MKVDFAKREKKGCPVRHIHALVEARLLSEAFAEAKNRIQEIGCLDLSDKLSAIENDYNLMLAYFLNGGLDPERSALFAKLCQRTHSFIDDLRTRISLSDNSVSTREKQLAQADNQPVFQPITDLISTTKQQLSQQPDALNATAPLAKELDVRRLSQAEVLALFDLFIADASLPVSARCFALGALAHNIISRHDRGVSLALTDALARSESALDILARESVMLVADIIAWPGRWCEDDILVNSLSILIERRPAITRTLRLVIISLFRMKLIPQVDEFLRVGLANELNEIAKKIVDREFKGDKNAISHIDIVELFGNDENVQKKFDKLSLWQEDDVDIAFQTYQYLKNTPFFSNPLNWLKPFDANESNVLQALASYDDNTGADLCNILINNKRVSDSDKYSTIFNLQHAPANSIQMLKNDMNAQQAQEKDEDDALQDYDLNTALAINRFVKDLFRAFMLRGNDFGFTDIFDNQANIVSSRIFPILYPSVEDADALGRFLVENNLMDDAAILYEHLSNADSTNADLLRKFALCTYHLGNTEKAVELLKRAELLDDSNIWTKSMLAESYFKLNRFSSALFYLDAIRALKNLSPHQLNLAAQCHKNLSHFKDALAIFAHLYEQSPDDANVALELATCCLALGKAPDAQKIISDIPDSESSPRLTLIKAELSLVNRNIRSAVDTLSPLVNGMSPAEARRLIEQDRKSLHACGIDDLDIDMTLDLARTHKQ